MSAEVQEPGEKRLHLRRVRVIPTLLIDGRGRLVKTIRFGKRAYIGDPINAVKIFNTKAVDELVLFDIDASRERRAPNYRLIEGIAGEAFMPVGYGGGIASMEHIAQLYGCGIEKVILSSCLKAGTSLISEATGRYGAQAVVICLQIKRTIFGHQRVRVFSASGRLGRKDVEEVAREVVRAGAGEIIVYDVDRDGTYLGYDLSLLKRVARAVEVPVVACGGARGLDDFVAAVREAGCSAVAAGSLFVYQSRGRGVLISYPSQTELVEKLFARPD